MIAFLLNFLKIAFQFLGLAGATAVGVEVFSSGTSRKVVEAVGDVAQATGSIAQAGGSVAKAVAAPANSPITGWILIGGALLLITSLRR